MRTDTSKTFDNLDGTFTTRIFDSPINYLDVDGKYKPIDSDLVPSDDPGYAVTSKANTFHASFKNKLKEGYLRLDAHGQSYEFSLEGAAEQEGEAHGESITYPSVFPGVDLHYGVVSEGIKESLLLADSSAPKKYDFTLDLPHDDYKAKRREDGSWAFFESDGDSPAFVITAPTATDFGGDEAPETPEATPTPSQEPSTAPSSGPSATPQGGTASPAADADERRGTLDVAQEESPSPSPAPAEPDDHSHDPHDPVAMHVSKGHGTFRLSLSVKQSWLDDPARIFPVELDPTVVIQPALQDGSWDAACGSCTSVQSDRLSIGTDNASHIWRAALKFDLAGIPAGVTITDAQMKLLYDRTCLAINPSGTDCGAQANSFDVHIINNSWTTSSTSSSFSYLSPAMHTQSLPLNAGSQWVSFYAKDAVLDWRNGVRPNNGLLVKRTTEAANAGGIRPFSSLYAAEPTLKPRLEVTWSGDGVDLDVPTTLHANGAELEWSRYTGPSGAQFQKYEVHRSQTSHFVPGASTLIATITDPSVTTYRDTTAAPATTYSYEIMANSSVSNEQRVTLPADGQATKLIQPHADEAKDAYINFNSGFQDCSNFGIRNRLYVGSQATYRERTLVRFDLSDVPADATIQQATLSLYHPGETSVPAGTLEVHRVTSDWIEGTGDWACSGDGVTWYQTRPGVNWAAQGGDFDSAIAASGALTANEPAGWEDFGVGSLVQKWTSGEQPNLGVLLKLANDALVGADNDFYFVSSDDPVESTRNPKLAITYAENVHANGPSVAISSPSQGQQVSGNVTISATASDDSRVDRVDFYVDGVSVGFDTTAPFSAVWNSTTSSNANHTLTAKATDDAGNQTTSSAVTVQVSNYAQPTVSITSPTAGATVSGTVPITATASAPAGVARVEFYFDGYRIDPAATTSPYQVSWNTLDPNQPAYNGAHTLTAKVFDSAGQSVTSASVNVTVANAPATKYKATIATTVTDGIPQMMSYDPAGPQQTHPISITVTNNSTSTWSGTDIVLRYQWINPDGTVDSTGPNVTLPAAALSPNGSGSVQATVTPPTLANGTNFEQYTLRFDLFEISTSSYFASKGNAPLNKNVAVNRVISAATGLGLEHYYQYEGEDVGAGMQILTNASSGNEILTWTPFSLPGRGLSSTMRLTYNTLEDHSDSPIGNNFSLSISSLTRFGTPLDVHPNKADTIAGRSNKFIQLVDGDGTVLKFTSVGTAGTVYNPPPGVHVYLRQNDPSTTYVPKKWALTRPDGVTFYYDSDGFPTEVKDNNGNRLSFTLATPAPGDDPGGPTKHITAVTDETGLGGTPAAHRSVDIAYYTKSDAPKARVRGKIKTITDHAGHVYRFDYYDDGNLMRITQVGGTRSDGSYLADRTFIFTYTTSSGSGPAIATPAARANPDPKTANQSSRLYSVRDPRGNETLLSYVTSGTDKWKVASRTDRATNATTFAYDNTNKITTVTAPMTRVTKYTYDSAGRVTNILDPLNQNTALIWTPDNEVSRMTQPGGAFTQYVYNDNGYPTSIKNELANETVLTYQNSAADALDIAANWVTGRTIAHISRLATKTSPKGVATVTPTNDFQWQYGYDTAGNLTTVRDPENNTTTYAYNTDGTISSVTDARANTINFPNYDANGLPTRMTQAVTPAKGQPTVTRTTTLSYDDDGLVRYVQDPLHQQYSSGDPRNFRTYFDYDAFNRLDRQSSPKSTQFELGDVLWTSAKYDANDNLISQTAPEEGAQFVAGPRTDVTYDVMDRPTLVDEPGTSARQQTTNAYDAAGRTTSVTRPRGTASTGIDKDFATYFAYDDLDRVKKETRYDVNLSTGAINNTLNTHYCYSTAGDLVSVTAPKANVASVTCATPPSFTSTFVYDAAHQLKSATDPLGHQQQATYDINGNVDTSTNENGAVMTYGYDQMDRITKEVEPFIGGATPRTETTKYVYDAVGNLSKTISPRAYDASVDKVTFTDYVTTYHYNEARELSFVDLPTNASTPAAFVYRAYDLNGQMTNVSLPSTATTYAGVATTDRTDLTLLDTGMVNTSNNHVDPIVHYRYDARGNQIKRWVEKKGAPASEADPGREDSWEYYPNGLLHTVSDPTSKTAPGSGKQIFTYDLDNNLATADSSAGLGPVDETPMDITAFYDSLDRTTKVNFQKSSELTARFTSYAYDLNSNVTTRVDNAVVGGAAGETFTFAYDQADWLQSQIDDMGTPADATDDQKVTTDFFATGWEKQRQILRNATAWNAKQTTVWDYFANGKLKSLSTTSGTATGQVKETHALSYLDASNNYVNGNRTEDLFGIEGPSTTQCTVAVKCNYKYTYDARDRVTKYVDGHTSANTTDYTLDPVGNITQTKLNGTVQANYNYQGARLNTVSNAAGAVQSRYIYDDFGNTDCIVNASYAGSSCPVIGQSNPNVQRNYDYDGLNRLQVYEKYDGTSTGTVTDSASYTYDALNRLTKQSEKHAGNTRNTAFSFLGTTSAITKEAITGSSLSSSRTYGYDAYGDRVSMTDTPSGAGGTPQTYTYGYDAHGSVSLLLNGTGGAAASYAYDPYGNADGAVTKETGTRPANDPLNVFRYSAMRYDSGSDTLDMGARRFGPDSRFLQEDQYLGSLDDLGLTEDPINSNRYSLAGGNPVSFIEWDGHYFLQDGGGGAHKSPRPRNGGDGGGGISIPASQSENRLASTERADRSHAITSSPTEFVRGVHRQERRFDKTVAETARIFYRYITPNRKAARDLARSVLTSPPLKPYRSREVETDTFIGCLYVCVGYTPGHGWSFGGIGVGNGQTRVMRGFGASVLHSTGSKAPSESVQVVGCYVVCGGAYKNFHEGAGTYVGVGTPGVFFGVSVSPDDMPSCGSKAADPGTLCDRGTVPPTFTVKPFPPS